MNFYYEVSITFAAAATATQQVAGDLSIVLVLGQPTPARKLVDAAGVQFVDDDLVQEPAGRRTGVVVADAQPLQRTERRTFQCKLVLATTYMEINVNATTAASLPKSAAAKKHSEGTRGAQPPCSDLSPLQ